jgi:O-antigen/teichoic acid export membrane protein
MLSNIVYVSIINASSAILLFILSVVLTNTMSQDSYGEYSYALAWLTIALSVGKFGLDNASLRFIPEYISASKLSLINGYCLSVNFLILTISIVMSFILAVLIWIFTHEIWIEYQFIIITTCAILPFFSLLMVNSSILRGMSFTIIPQLIVKILPHTIILIGILAFYIMDGPVELSSSDAITLTLFAYVFALLAIYILYKIKTNYTLSLGREYDFKKWMKVTTPMMLTAFLVQIQAQIDIVIVGAYLSTSDIALYSVVKKIVGVLIFVLYAANMVVAPIISKLWFSKKINELQNYLTTIARIFILTSIPLSLILYFYGVEILYIFGNEYAKAYPALLILTAGQLISSVIGVVGLIMNMTDYQNHLTKVLLLTSILSVILSFLLIPTYGIEGAAFSFSLATIVSNIYLYFFVLRTHRLNTLLYKRVQ